MILNKHLLKFLILVVLGAFLTACGGDENHDHTHEEDEATAVSTEAAVTNDASSDEVQIEINLFNFSEKEITVPAGTTVTWINNDGTQHSVTSGTPDDNPDGDGTFDSDFFEEGETFSMVFDKPGEYHYFCRRHSHMQAVVIVTEP